jgi:predicted transport protein
MTIEKAYENLRDVVLAMEPDVRKAQAGNKAAGRRVRKGMQDIKKQAQDVRVGISLEFKNK